MQAGMQTQYRPVRSNDKHCITGGEIVVSLLCGIRAQRSQRVFAVDLIRCSIGLFCVSVAVSTAFLSQTALRQANHEGLSSSLQG